MAETSLSVTSGNGGGQDPSTQSNLQASGQSDLSNGLTGKVQPGIAADQLKSSQGITLSPTALSTVALSGGSTSATTAQTAPAKQHMNPYLVGLSILFLIVAVIAFISTMQSGKKHNQYK